MPFNLLYTIHLDDDEFYPYWVGVSGKADMPDRFSESKYWNDVLNTTGGIDYAQNHKPLEHWCMDFAIRGYHFTVEHDAFNGSHQVYQFISRADAMRFLLQNIMTDNRIST